MAPKRTKTKRTKSRSRSSPTTKRTAGRTAAAGTTATARKKKAAKKGAERKKAGAKKRVRTKSPVHAKSLARAKSPARQEGPTRIKSPARAKNRVPAREQVGKSKSGAAVLVRVGAKKGRTGARATKPAAGRGPKPPRSAVAGGSRRRQSGASKKSLLGRARPSVRKVGIARPVRSARRSPVAGVSIRGPLAARYDEVLTPGALSFLADLHRQFERRRRDLLELRRECQARFDAGELPDFLAETNAVRAGDWTIAPVPADLRDRRVEITGPVDRKMIINALNSGARVFMADFEDANAPTWSNNIEGQINLKDRWMGRIGFTDPVTGKNYRLGEKPAVLIVRPRGWHLPEQHLAINGDPISGALFDFGLYCFHNAKRAIDAGSGPYFYLPKLESHREARLWNDVFIAAQDAIGIARGTIKATVLIETLPAAFEMDEILYELRDHVTGLNAGRWDYIFSFIKKLAKNPEFVLPDRAQVTMGKAFLRAYSLLLIKTCHRRGAFAMGGMAAQIPIKNDPVANAAALAKVRADKEREVRDGHDGTWVAHPDLVPVAREVFDRLMPQPNQLDRKRDDVAVGRADLLEIHDGTKTAEGFRLNIRVGVQYLEAWLRGRGAVPIYNLMEDAATAEISRAQIWQWIKYAAVLEDGTMVTREFFLRALDEEMRQVRREVGDEAYATGRFTDAIKLFRDLSLSDEFEDFLTLPAYRLLV